MTDYVKHRMYLRVARELASESHCVSYQVGTILVKEGRIISTGLNGTPSGYINCDQKFPKGKTAEHHEWSNVHEIHSEMNAILWAARKGVAIDGSIAYCTLRPCFNCTKALIGAGITAIYYAESYNKHTDEHEILLDTFIRDNNVHIEKVAYEL